MFVAYVFETDCVSSCESSPEAVLIVLTTCTSLHLLKASTLFSGVDYYSTVL